MNRIFSSDLYPMRVNPFNFSKGDVVKKVITDNIKTPYTGIVIAVIPSTNKVIVQWPNGEGYEDPWDLIKINPILEPPVVNQDKAYPSFQNELSHRYFEKIKPHRVLEDFIKEELNPIIVHISNLYNRGYSKAGAFKKTITAFDNKELVQEGINRIYSDRVDVKYAREVIIDGDKKNYSLRLAGNSEQGFGLTIFSDKQKKTYLYNNIVHAAEKFNSYKNIIKGYTSEIDYAGIVKKVLGEMRKS